MTHPKLEAALNVGDRVALWILVAISAWTLREIALRADRDPPSLISPACVTTPAKGGK